MAHRESRDIGHRLRVDVRADLLHHVDAVAVRRGRAADQIIRAVLGKSRHQLGVAGVAAGRHDDRLLRVIAHGLTILVRRHDRQNLTLIVGNKLGRRRVKINGHSLVSVARQHRVHDFVRRRLILGRIVRARLIGTRHGIQLMLRSEHAALAGGAHGREVVFRQTVIPQPLNRIHVLIHIGTDERFVAQMRAVVQDILNIALLGVLDAVNLLNDGFRAGHGAGRKVQRAAGLAGLFQHDYALCAVVDRFNRRGQSAAARANDDDIRALCRFFCRCSRQSGEDHRHGQDGRQNLLHKFFLLLMFKQ